MLSWAHARARARATRDWDEADRLRADIESAGWKVVDRGTDFALEPMAPADMHDGERPRYGASTSVPSRLEAAPVGIATVIVVATDWPLDLDRTIEAVRRHAPPATSLVVVANEPSDAQGRRLEQLELAATDDRLPTEVLWTSARVGHATALNMGLRRAGGPVAIVLDTSVELTGDGLGPLVAALDDPTVALAGGWGIVSDDLRTFHAAAPGDVDAIEGYLMAFRRADFAERGPLDERFRFYRNLDIWWSLVLRDEGLDRPARRARMLDGIEAIRHDHRGYASLEAAERDRQSKRNFYRIIDRFGPRRDLLVGS